MKALKHFFSALTKQSPFVELSTQLFMQTPAATVVTDDKGTIVNVNHAFEALSGYGRAEALGERMSLLKSGQQDHAFYKSFWQKLLEFGQNDCEIYNCCKDGTVLLMHERVMPIDSDGKRYYVVTFEDITQQKKQAERYRHLATHDALTGLANRTLMQDRFSHATLNAIRNGKKVGLLMCDLNEFKQFNDAYGHNFGDTILRKVAEKLKQLVRISDTVARYGGDEFILILEQIEHADEVLMVVDEIKKAFPFSLRVDAEICEIGISVGHACFPDEGSRFEQLLIQADAKMYESKECYFGY